MKEGRGWRVGTKSFSRTSVLCPCEDSGEGEKGESPSPPRAGSVLGEDSKKHGLATVRGSRLEADCCCCGGHRTLRCPVPRSPIPECHCFAVMTPMDPLCLQVLSVPGKSGREMFSFCDINFSDVF